MKNLSKKLKLILITAIAALFVIGAWLYLGDVLSSKSLSAEDFARKLVESCANEEYRPFCYETEIPKLTKELETYEIFDVIRAIRDHDPEYVFCHVAAHNLGQFEVAKDPENWLDVLAKSPTDGLCSNGFAHGAVLARFNQEIFTEQEIKNIVEQFKLVCEPREGWSPTDLHRAMCYHGLGHVLVHVTETDVPQSLEACEDIANRDDGDFRRVCREGVYMQLFQPLEPEDYALIDLLEMQPNRENIYEFCQNYSSTQDEFDVCWREAWPFFGEDIKTAKGIGAYCGIMGSNESRDQCYVSSFTINARHNLGNQDNIKSVCDSVGYDRRGDCYGIAANAYLEEGSIYISDGVSMCEQSTDSSVAHECFEYLANLAEFNFGKGSSAYSELCESLPAELSKTCLD